MALYVNNRSGTGRTRIGRRSYSGGGYTQGPAGAISNEKGAITKNRLREEQAAAQKSSTPQIPKDAVASTETADGKPGVLVQNASPNFISDRQRALSVEGGVASTVGPGGAPSVIVGRQNYSRAVYTQEAQDRGRIIGDTRETRPSLLSPLPASKEQRLRQYNTGQRLIAFGERITDKDKVIKPARVINAPLAATSDFAGGWLQRFSTNPGRETAVFSGSAAFGGLFARALPVASSRVGATVAGTRLAQATGNPVFVGSLAAKGTNVAVQTGGTILLVNELRNNKPRDLPASEIVGFGAGAAGYARTSSLPYLDRPVRVRNPADAFTQRIFARPSTIRGRVVNEPFQDFNIPRGERAPGYRPIPNNRALDPDVVFPQRVRPDIYQQALRQGRESVIEISDTGSVTFVPRTNRPTYVRTSDVVRGSPRGFNPRTGEVELVQGSQVLIQEPILAPPRQTGLSANRFGALAGLGSRAGSRLGVAPNRFGTGLVPPRATYRTTALSGGTGFGGSTSQRTGFFTSRSIGFGTSQLSSQAQNVGQQLSFATAQGSRQSTSLSSLFRQPAPRSTAPRGSFSPPAPGAGFPFVPLIGGGRGGGKRGKRGSSSGRSRYSSSVTAGAFGIRARRGSKRSTGFTGLEIRGI